LPDRDGLELIPLIRQKSDAAVLIVSARDATEEKVAALDLGALDYVTKPFDTEELLARVRVALRSRLAADGGQAELAIGDVRFDFVRRRILKRGEEVHLTPKEYGVVAELARFPGRVITHEKLLAAVWPHDHERHVEYLRVVVRNIRHKLEDDPVRPALIVNELGVGYRLADPAA
jgi:two-component system, OmpR family, KDP operon response regulator KdpE